MWATAEETRRDILDRYQRACEHADATIDALPIDAPGYVPWWPRPDVKLFNVMVHILTETSRHAGHADILREQLDGTVGQDRRARSCTDSTRPTGRPIERRSSEPPPPGAARSEK